MSKDLKDVSTSDLIAEIQEVAEHFEQVSLPAVKSDDHSTEIYENWIKAIGEACFRLRETDQELLVAKGEVARVIKDELKYNDIEPTEKNIKTVIEDVCLIDMPQWLHDNVEFAIQEGKIT